MKNLFIEKLNNQQYISKYLFENILENYKEIIPNDFNLDQYNNDIIETEYQKHKNYFENMYKEIDDNIHLDEEQIKAIIADEDYSLIIAGAGTGKTTTMASKVKYLVDIKKVDPRKIAVMSFTKKATEELEKRITIDFEIPARVTTFHSLGMIYIREIFKNRKCSPIDNNEKEQIFLNYFKEKIFPYKERLEEILEIFDSNLLSKSWVFGKYFKENYHKYKTFDEYFESYKINKKLEVKDFKTVVNNIVEKKLNQEQIYTICGELVKSKGEAIIANFLYCNGIEYEYEKIYDELMTERRAYHPDFTIDLGGEKIYIEYFGLSNYEKSEENRYNKIRVWKRNYHKLHHNKFIELNYEQSEVLINDLKEQLLSMGFTLKEKSYEEIYEKILDTNPTSQFYPFKNFLYDIITNIKSSLKRKEYKIVIEEYISNLSQNESNLALKQFKYIDEFYHYYQNYLFSGDEYKFDFSDMIYYANMYMSRINSIDDTNFEYLIIDEYQDISQERYEFTKNISLKNNAKVVAVGDDWQSIYAFTGSKIEYIYDFQKYFKGSKLFKITKTYRNSQDLINYSGNFIMKNNQQIKKSLVSNKETINPIRFIPFEDDEYNILKKLILKIHYENPTHNIMILARTNKLIKQCYNDPELKDDIGTKIKYVGYEEINIDGMTMHKSKGLTSDEVILIGLNQTFPHPSYELFWLESLFKPKPVKESIEFAEERRLFYVALTRTKNYVYLLVNKDPKLRSSFINEIYNIIKENI